MVKGGCRPKGRPRKLGNFIPQTQHTITTPTAEIGESSRSAAASESHTPVPTFDGTIESIKTRIELEIHESEMKQQPDLKTEEEKEVVAQKVEEGEVPPMRKRGMALGFVAPTFKQGKPTAQLCGVEIAIEAAKWDRAVILYVIGEAPTITYLKNYVRNHCGIVGNLEIFYHNEGYFLLRFEDLKDKDRMLLMDLTPLLVDL